MECASHVLPALTDAETDLGEGLPLAAQNLLDHGQCQHGAQFSSQECSLVVASLPLPSLVQRNRHQDFRREGLALPTIPQQRGERCGQFPSVLVLEVVDGRTQWLLEDSCGTDAVQSGGMVATERAKAGRGNGTAAAFAEGRSQWLDLGQAGRAQQRAETTATHTARGIEQIESSPGPLHQMLPRLRVPGAEERRKRGWK